MIINKRSLIAAALSAALVAGSLAGCTGGSGSGGVTTLNWWTRIGDLQKQQIKEFNASHKNIQVKVTQISDDQYVNKVGTGVRSSHGPDVLDFDDANAPLFGATGVLANVTDKVNVLGFK